MSAMKRIHLIASPTESALAALARLTERYGQTPLAEAVVVVPLGGDGLMLSTLHRQSGLPVYGMNRGTVGFLMNEYGEEGLVERIETAEMAITHPLSMIAGASDGTEYHGLAINEVSLLRAGPQAA